MYDVNFLAAIHNVSVKANEKDGVIRRTCKLTLAREFDEVVAAGLGAEAKRVLKAITKGGITEVVLPMDASTSKLTLKCAGLGEVTIPAVKGMRAKAKASADEAMPPSVKLEYEFDFFEPAWIFLGRNISSYADVEIVQLQTTLSFARGE